MKNKYCITCVTTLNDEYLVTDEMGCCDTVEKAEKEIIRIIDEWKKEYGEDENQYSGISVEKKNDNTYILSYDQYGQKLMHTIMITDISQTKQ